MLITNDMVIILTLGCFIIGMVMGIRLMQPHHYYNNSRGHLPTSHRRYDD